MKCSDISSRLVDFLYEELSAAERTEFNAHLASCPSCAAEVKVSSRTLQRTRTALAGPLNEDPPARVHANIMATARAAAQPARKPQLAEKEGFFARLWKAPWLIPAMGAAGVATAVFLIKVIKNPEVLPVREPASPVLSAKPQPTTEDQVPQPAAAPAEPQAEQTAATKDEARPTAIGKSVGAASRPGHTRPASRAAAPAPAPVKRKISDDLLMDLDVRRAPTIDKSRESASEGATPMMKHAAPAPAVTNTPAPAPKPAATARPLNAPGNWAEPPPPRGLGGKDRRAEGVDMLMKESASGAGVSQPRGEVLRAKPQRAAEAPSPAPAASGFALPPAPSAPPAKPAPPASEPRGKAKKSAALEDMPDEVAESVPLHSVSSERESDRAEKKGAAKPESLQERARKADRLYEEKKWAQAAAAYSALLVEAPSHPNAPTWRKRLVFAERAAKGQPSNEP